MEKREKNARNREPEKKKKRGRREGEVIPDQPMDSRATRVVVVAATQTDKLIDSLIDSWNVKGKRMAF